MSRFVSFLVLIAILVVISIIFFQVMAGFLVPLFLAALLGVVVQPLYRWMLERCNGYRHVAAGVTTTLVALIVLLPIALVITTATLEGISLVDRLQLGDVRTRLDKLRADFGLEIPREEDVRQIELKLKSWRDKQLSGETPLISQREVAKLQQRVGSIEEWITEHGDAADVKVNPTDLNEALQRLHDSEEETVERDDALTYADAQFRTFKRDLLGGTYRAWLTEWANPSDERLDQVRKSVMATAGPVLEFGGDTALILAKIGFGTLIMIVALFFLLAEGEAMLKGLIQISPLEESHVRELVAEFDRACRAIVSATLFSALAQGLLAGVGFYFCGLRSSVALLTLLTMVLALVPFTGAAAVWIPVCLWLYFYQGSLTAAIGLAVYGTFIISGSDNVIKPLVLHGQSKLHPLLALLSVLGGIQALGPIGIVVGPMAVVFLQTILKILQRELMSMDRSSWTFWRGFGGVEPAAAAGVVASATAEIVSAPGVTIETASPGKPSPTQGNGHAKPGPAKQHQQGKKRKR